MKIRPLCPLLQEKAEKELFEKSNRISSDVEAIKEWLKKQPHLQAVNPTDQWLIAFLRGNKYSLERTKEKCEMYYTLRTVVPEIFKGRDPMDPYIQDILNLGFFLPTKSCKSTDACKATITRFGASDSSKYHLLDIMKVMFMIIEILLLEDDNFVVAGMDVLFDMKGVGINILSQWTPTIAKKLIFLIEKALPVRMKSSHVIYIPPGFEAAYNLFKAFVADKIKQRFHLYGQNHDGMYDALPRSILPKEYGGDDGSLQELIDFWKRKVESYRDWFLKEETERSNEALRPDKSKTTSNLFGVEGSFRQLDID
ncbi:hypothetical protein KGM_214234 [Danaus plexippus plexippus]|uniref:Uncharacterized protein n=1 Tax=Danaus plexippus plexippus TaxID=278856 RepID=A0A212FL29_DANPL|nr:hypothetical protein KGM_214234 [Danaus plexippus plexippus]